MPLDVSATPLCSAIEVDWNGPASDGGSPLTRSSFVRSNGTLVATDLVDGSTFTKTPSPSGPTNDTTYDVTVAGVNDNGVGSESDAVQVAPECAPTPPRARADASASPLCSALEVTGRR